MKIIRSKSFLTSIFTVFIIGFSTSATTLIGYPSFISLLPVTLLTSGDLTGGANSMFVTYPSNLKDHRVHTKDYVKAYSETKREYVIHIFEKGKKFFPKAIAILAKYDVPKELQMLPVLESEFNANAVSPVGAVGYWQFMSELAKEYGLRTGGKYDDRRNFTKSTTAAAKFLRDQMDYFNDDLLLVVASYNCGAGRVRSSIKKSGIPNAGYWDIKQYLPTETKKFVMNFIALNVISANYEKFIDKTMNFNEAALIPFNATDSTSITDSLSTKFAL